MHIKCGFISLQQLYIEDTTAATTTSAATCSPKMPSGNNSFFYISLSDPKLAYNNTCVDPIYTLKFRQTEGYLFRPAASYNCIDSVPFIRKYIS